MATEDSRRDGSQQAALGPGSTIGTTWVVERLLGKGGMGAVWLARHQRLGQKRAAIKVLLGAGLKDEAYRRFAREAEIATRIGHPNIVDVLDMAALDTGEPYIVLEYLQGETLRDRLRRVGRLPFAEVAALTRQIGSALLAAHRHDVVHRDLKPENVFLVPTDSGGVIHDHVKVLDFGISKLRGSQSLQTQEAAILGTPQYMAPEQARGQNSAVEPRTDQFALAVMVYEMLAGRPPWSADTPLGLLFQVVNADTPPLHAEVPEVPGHAVLAIERALAKDAHKRFADIGAFVEALTGQPLQSLMPRATAQGPAAEADLNADTVDASAVGLVTVDAETPPMRTQGLAPDIDADTLDAPPSLRPAVVAAPVEVSIPLSLSASDAAALATAPTRRGLPWSYAVVAVVVVASAAYWAMSEAPQTARLPAFPAPTVAPVAPAPAPAAVAVAPEPAVAPPAAATPVVAPAPPAPVAVDKPVAHTNHTEVKAKVAEPTVDVPDEVVQAEAALSAGRLSDAARLAEHSLLTRPTSRAFAVLTKVRCRQGDLGGARTWFGQIRGAGAQAAVRKACAKDGVTW
jgi:serine/threonine-protein kinase